MDTALHQEEQNKRRGMITSALVHLILLILILLPLLTFPDPPPGQAGVLVSFGEPNVGQGEEEPAPAKQPEVVEPVEEPPVEEELAEREVEEEKPKEKPREKPKRDNTKKVNTDDNSKELALKRKKEKERKAKEAADRKRKAEADAARKVKEAEARRKAEAEARKKAEYDKQKSKIGDLFNNSSGQGSGSGSQGNSGTPGNAGNPDGDPDASRLEGLGKGKGDVSGFGDRGFKRPSPISGNFQETGTVNLKVCVDGNGKVISAKPKLSGSTTQSSKLQNLAIANAKKYRFDRSSIDQQCGTITYRFQLQ